MSGDWNPNSTNPRPFVPAVEARTIPATPPVMASPPPRPSRVGPALFVVGLGLISINFLVSAWAYYVEFNSPSINTFQWVELAEGLGEVLVGFGVLLGTAGWLLGKRDVARYPRAATQDNGATRRGVGQVVVIFAALLISGASFYFGGIELAVYYNVPITFAAWTLSLIYALEGIGILGLAIGWWIHRTGSESR
jgi:hypothetical protein